MEKSVREISVCTILPATYQASRVPRRIDLTPWDLQFLPFPPNPRGLLFSANLTPLFLQQLKDSLSRTLDFFYPLAGRMCSLLNVSNDSTLFYITCNNAGVEFVHAVADGITLDDLLQPVYVPSLMRLLFPFTQFNSHSKPFFAVQVTELANGGFILGCVMSHSFGDGSSFWHVLNSWSEICRGCDSPKNVPVLERYYPGQKEIWIPNRLIVKPMSTEDHMSTSYNKERIFIFPKEKLALLKKKAIEESGIQSISTLQALIGFFCKMTFRHCHIPDEDDVIVGMGIGVRTKIVEPTYSPYYLGNMVYPVMTSVKLKDLRAQDGLGRAASKLHDFVISQTDASCKEFITSWIENPYAQLGKTNYESNKLVLTSSQ